MKYFMNPMTGKAEFTLNMFSQGECTPWDSFTLSFAVNSEENLPPLNGEYQSSSISSMGPTFGENVMPFFVHKNQYVQSSSTQANDSIEDGELIQPHDKIPNDHKKRSFISSVNFIDIHNPPAIYCSSSTDDFFSFYGSDDNDNSEEKGSSTTTICATSYPHSSIPPPNTNIIASLPSSSSSTNNSPQSSWKVCIKGMRSGRYKSWSALEELLSTPYKYSVKIESPSDKVDHKKFEIVVLDLAECKLGQWVEKYVSYSATNYEHMLEIGFVKNSWKNNHRKKVFACVKYDNLEIARSPPILIIARKKMEK